MSYLCGEKTKCANVLTVAQQIHNNEKKRGYQLCSQLWPIVWWFMDPPVREILHREKEQRVGEAAALSSGALTWHQLPLRRASQTSHLAASLTIGNLRASPCRVGQDRRTEWWWLLEKKTEEIYGDKKNRRGEIWIEWDEARERSSKQI